MVTKYHHTLTASLHYLVKYKFSKDWCYSQDRRARLQLLAILTTVPPLTDTRCHLAAPVHCHGNTKTAQ